MWWPDLLGAAGVSGSSSTFNFFLGFRVLLFDRGFCFSPAGCLQVGFGVLLAVGFTGGGVCTPDFGEVLGLLLPLFAFLAFLSSALVLSELLVCFPDPLCYLGSIVVVPDLEEPDGPDPEATDGMLSPRASISCSSVSSWARSRFSTSASGI